MNRDTVEIDKIFKKGIPFIGMKEAVKSYVEQERTQAIGWTHAEACTAADRGEDFRKTEVSSMLERAFKDLDLVPNRDSGEGNEFANAMNVLRKALNEDSDYYRSWKDNIAMAFKDYYNVEKNLHENANIAASRFLDILIR